MSDMVERVAGAISSAFHEEGYIEGLSHPSEWEEFRKAAREAIKVMREPTKEMVCAVLDANDKRRTLVPEDWKIMIDAALGLSK